MNRTMPSYWAGNQAEVTTMIALDTTYTGCLLKNPQASGKRLYLEKVGISLSVAPAAVSVIGLMGGWLITGIAAAGASGFSAHLGAASGDASIARWMNSATLVGTPRLIAPLMSGYTAAALPNAALPAWIDVDGDIAINPGGWVAIYTLTVVLGFFSFLWSEEVLP